MEAKHIRKSHNKSLLVYHLVCSVKYRRKVFTQSTEETLKGVCLGFGPANEIHFLEIGIDQDHVHFLIQRVPNIRFPDMVKKIKRISARVIFREHPEVKEHLWGGKFWTSGYYVNTVGQYGDLGTIKNYVKRQGYPKYKQLHQDQLTLFE